MKNNNATSIGSANAYVWAIVLGGLLLDLVAFGEGFRNPPPDAFSLGRAGGRITHIDGAAAVHQNPANLVGLTNAQFEFTPSVVYIHVEHESQLGLKAQPAAAPNVQTAKFLMGKTELTPGAANRRVSPGARGNGNTVQPAARKAQMSITEAITLGTPAPRDRKSTRLNSSHRT